MRKFLPGIFALILSASYTTNLFMPVCVSYGENNNSLPRVLVMSDEYGENIDWKITEDTLTISDTINWYICYAFGYAPSPWYKYRNIIEKVIIEDKVSYIEKDLFEDCDYLTSIKINNPNCKIYDSSYTFPNGATIYGYTNSTAHEYAEKYNRKFVSLDEKISERSGDANCDNLVNISDAVFIMQSLSNPNKYVLSEQAKKNSDVIGNDGVTANDALVIQMVKINKIPQKDLPINKLNKYTVEDDFKANMDSIINGAYDSNFRYLNVNGRQARTLSNGKISDVIISNIDYVYKNKDAKDECAVLTVEFTYPDVVIMTDEVEKKNPDFSSDEVAVEVASIISSGDFRSKTEKINIPLVSVNDTWYILENEKFKNVITGGVYSEYLERNKEIYNNLKEYNK